MVVKKRKIIAASPVTVSNLITVTATYAGAPTLPTATFADFPNDYQTGLTLMHDDGTAIENDISALIKNYHYSDNAGGTRQVGYGFGINGRGNALRDGTNNTVTTWAQYQSILQDDNIVLMNHTADHTNTPTAISQLTDNEAIVRTQFGIEMNTIIVPSGLGGFVQAGLDLGTYRLISSEGYGGTADGYNNEVHYSVEGINQEKIITNRMMITTRKNMDGLFVSGQSSLRSWLDTHIADDLATGKKRIHAAFSHAPASAQELTYLGEFIAYALTVNGGKMWMGNPQQFSDYIDVKDNAVKSTITTNGNTITFTIDLSNVHSRNKYKDMSLKLTGGTLSNVTVAGADSYTFNSTTGLVNIYKK